MFVGDQIIDKFRSAFERAQEALRSILYPRILLENAKSPSNRVGIKCPRIAEATSKYFEELANTELLSISKLPLVEALARSEGVFAKGKYECSPILMHQTLTLNQDQSA